MAPDALAQRLDVVRETSGLPPAALSAFEQRVRTAPDEELFRMSPVRAAASLGLDENTAIELFLHATRAGILDFTWGVLCAACGAFLTTPAALKALARKHECTMCQMEAPVRDETVEVAFTVSPAVRRLRFHEQRQALHLDWLRLLFSPSRVLPERLSSLRAEDIVLADRVLKPGESTVFQRDFQHPRYAVVAPMQHAWAHFDMVAEAPSEAEVSLLEARLVPARQPLRPGPGEIRVHNRSNAEVQFALINSVVRPPEAWGGKPPTPEFRPYLTGKRLVTHQTFRDLFRAESIPSEGGLEFKSLTMLFTDLKGSTEMYERIGDFRAYALVREHFALLREIIAARGGSMVKTIGDAVMASFAEAAPAVEAAAEMNRQIRRVGDGKALQLKIGLHAGPCIAVESNERLDYFGQTVNIAARVQGVAEANEIVVTEPVFRAPRAEEVIRDARLQARPDRALLKGVDGEVSVYRLQ